MCYITRLFLSVCSLKKAEKDDYDDVDDDKDDDVKFSKKKKKLLNCKQRTAYEQRH